MNRIEVTTGFQHTIGRITYVVPPLSASGGSALIVTGDAEARPENLVRLLVGYAAPQLPARPPPGRIRCTHALPIQPRLPIQINRRSFESIGTDELRTLSGYANADADILLGRTVLENYLLALARHSEERAQHVVAMHQLSSFNLAHKAHERVSRLSGGQRQRLAIAAAIAGEPVVVAVDLTSNHLDEEYRRVVFDVGARLLSLGHILILGLLHPAVVPEPIGRNASVLSLVSQGNSLQGTWRPFSQYGANLHQYPPALPHLCNQRPLGACLFSARRLQRRDRQIAPITFSIQSGERVCLTGPNGIGKTSVAEIVAGQVPRWQVIGDYELASIAFPGFATQFPHQWLVGQSPMDELPDAALLDAIDIKPASLLAPIEELSFAKRRLLSSASALHYSRGLAILDEPTAGLDFRAKGQFRDLLNHFSQLALLFVSHDPAVLSLARPVEMSAQGGVP